jgi:hypothetical protein
MFYDKPEMAETFSVCVSPNVVTVIHVMWHL